MGNMLSKDTDYLIVTLSNQLYALPYYKLVQIIDSPSATKLPNIHGNVRGTINFLGEMVVLYDMRKSLGIPSMAEEVSQIVRALAERKQDHIKWLGKLKDEVHNNKEISVQTDPHKCAFGKWYDNFKPESISLAQFMTRFEAPHKHIHHLAVKAQELLQAGNLQQANEMILEAENKEFVLLLKLFDNAEGIVRSLTFEYAVVIEQGDKKVAVSVDAVKSFERFNDICVDVPAILKRASGDFVQAIGRRDHHSESEDVLIVDIDRVLTTSSNSVFANA